MEQHQSRREQQLEMEKYVDDHLEEIQDYVDEQVKDLRIYVEKHYAIKLVQAIVFGAVGIIAAAVLSALVYSVVKKY